MICLTNEREGLNQVSLIIVCLKADIFKSSFYTKIISDPNYSFAVHQKLFYVARYKVCVFHRIQPNYIIAWLANRWRVGDVTTIRTNGLLPGAAPIGGSAHCAWYSHYNPKANSPASRAKQGHRYLP